MARSANDNDKGAAEGELTGRPCPICSKPGVMRYKPFCSRRCADVDLGRWLSGSYAVPSAPEEAEDDEDIPDEPRER
jgi:endogenous inhibitor of DNA gyrase (YacG/DUF329 family)